MALRAVNEFVSIGFVLMVGETRHCHVLKNGGQREWQLRGRLNIGR